MTHPLVSAFHSLVPLHKEFNASESISWRAGLKCIMRPQYEWISEVMASTPQISGYVGFLESSEGEPLLIWLWPLSLGYEQYFWIEDQTFSRPFSL